MNKNIYSFIMRLHSLGTKKIKIVTNGSLLTDNNIDKLIASGIGEVEVSFDGESPEENNLIRRNGNFYRDAQNVKSLAARSKDISITISNVRIFNEKDILNYTNTTPPLLFTKTFF